MIDSNYLPLDHLSAGRCDEQAPGSLLIFPELDHIGLKLDLPVGVRDDFCTYAVAMIGGSDSYSAFSSDDFERHLAIDLGVWTIDVDLSSTSRHKANDESVGMAFVQGGRTGLFIRFPFLANAPAHMVTLDGKLYRPASGPIATFSRWRIVTPTSGTDQATFFARQ